MRTFLISLASAIVGVTVHAYLTDTLFGKSLPDVVTVDSPNLCKALFGRKTAYLLELSGTNLILLPAVNEDEAQYFSRIGFGEPIAQDVKKTFKQVNVQGCE